VLVVDDEPTSCALLSALIQTGRGVGHPLRLPREQE
jgi:hypothetical protein